jgi:hypothetical protein
VLKRALIIVGLACLAIAVFSFWVCRAPALPSARIKLVAYESRQNSVVATVDLRNTGTSPLSYHDTSEGVCFTILAQVRGKETNWSSGGGTASMAGPIVVWASQSARIRVVLPIGTEKWCCTLPLRGTGARIRVFTDLCEWGIWNRTFPVSQWSLRLFPLNDSDERKIQTDTFAVTGHFKTSQLASNQNRPL